MAEGEDQPSPGKTTAAVLHMMTIKWCVISVRSMHAKKQNMYQTLYEAEI
jgi:hypothetical protein